MMFMMTMPPTSSDSDTRPISTAKAPWLKLFQSSMNVSEVTMPKLSLSRGLSRREVRSATRASSIAWGTSDGSSGLTVISKLRREPNIFWKVPSGISTKSSCELPNRLPFFSLTPTTRKWTPLTMMVCSSGLRPLNSLSAVSLPM